MSYLVQEIFPTLQGEGAQSGRAAIFLRFSGCNLWSGREEDRASAACQFCDTEFATADGENGGSYATAEALADAVSLHRHAPDTPLWVVCTGGEPLLQLDAPLIAALHDRGFRVAVETNGTRPAPEGLDWICVSPKAGTKWVQRRGDELKVVWPQPFDLAELSKLPFGNFFLQPQDAPDPSRRDHNLRATIRKVMDHPDWRLSAQVHKLVGMP